MPPAMSARGGGGFVLNDPVYVERGDERLEGIVAYVGPVKFAEGSNWIGVRLTGASAGLGKNDGTVKGEWYFNCGPNNGMFVRSDHIHKRKLTKLEELRLKREMGSSGASGPPATAASSSSSSIAPALSGSTGIASAMASQQQGLSLSHTPNRLPRGSSGGSTASVSTSISASGAAAAATAATANKKSKLLELRERRAARSSGATHPGNASVATPPVSELPSLQNEEDAKRIAELEEELDATKTKLGDVSEKLQAKEQENSSLQQSLSQAEQDAHDSKSRVNTLEDELAAAKEAVKLREKKKSIIMTPEELEDELERVKEELYQLQQSHKDVNEELSKYQQERLVLQRELDREKEGRAADITSLTQVRSELSAIQHELNARNEQASARTSNDASHYKERAKLQAELGAAKRQIEQLEGEKLDMETSVEELALDKEQLQEEKEALEDHVEELKIDAETAQMELEELKLELEDAKATAERAIAGEHDGAGGSTSDTDEALQSVSIQNARLREAVIRLREQAAMDKLEATRQLRDVEKELGRDKALAEEVSTLKEKRAALEEELSDLKEMVEQGSAFEGMVEDLSDRVLDLEDANVALQATIRELEEAGDIAAEMEEVQQEEVKALMRDVEGRDSIILNLEEAIKMQRRREEDFQRTVGNYRSIVERLKQEKSELLMLQQGGEGEKNDLLATSQKALARAAQLVSDAAKARKRAAEAAFTEVASDGLRHLSERLESFIPQGVVSPELAAIKGELLLCQIVGKASKTLGGIEEVFGETIRSGADEVVSEVQEAKAMENNATLELTDESFQAIESLMYQTRYSVAVVSSSTSLIRLLAAGQWPDLLDVDKSLDLGAIFGHTLGELDAVTSNTLKILKEEGILSPHQANLGAFEQTMQTTLQTVGSSFDLDNKPMIPSSWNPPALNLLKCASTAKYLCLGCASAIASAINPTSSTQGTSVANAVPLATKTALKGLMTTMYQITAKGEKAVLRLGKLDIKDEKTVNNLDYVASEWMKESQSLFEAVDKLFTEKNEFKWSQVVECAAKADVVEKELITVQSRLRAAGLKAEDDMAHHPMSVETEDVWEGLTNAVQAVRGVDGDPDDVNFLVRAREIEHRFHEAIENEPKLASAAIKISSLEKSLASRSKEIAMQNARLAELEKVLARTSAQPTPEQKTREVASSDELNNLKQENRILTEAMEVLQSQVDEYESELRTLKDPKSPKPRGTATPSRRGQHLFADFATPRRHGRGVVDDGGSHPAASQASIAALEAAVFRPALEYARNDASRWKAKAMGLSLADLPPLNFPSFSAEDESKTGEPYEEHPLARLAAAKAELRLAKASVSVVDLSRKDRSPQSLFLESIGSTAVAEENLRQAAAAATQWLSKSKGEAFSTSTLSKGTLLGQVKFPSTSGSGVQTTVPISVTREDLNKLHFHILA